MQWCSVWTIIVIIGKWAPGRSGYRVIINSIYSLLSLLSLRTHNFTQSQASAPPLTSHNWNRSKKSGYNNHNNWLHNINWEKEKICGRLLRECLFDHFSSFVTRSQARRGHCRQGPFIVPQSNSGRAWPDKRGKHSNNHTRITSEQEPAPASRLIWVTAARAGGTNSVRRTQEPHSTMFTQCYYWPRATLALVASWLIQNETQDSITMRIDGR